MELVTHYRTLAQDWLYRRYIRPHTDKEGLAQEAAEADHALAMAIPAHMTLDQLKAEHHVVTTRLDRNMYRESERDRLLERQDKMEFMIKKMGRKG